MDYADMIYSDPPDPKQLVHYLEDVAYLNSRGWFIVYKEEYPGIWQATWVQR
jgi:hypothetical protein